jgi:hypothetical protein
MFKVQCSTFNVSTRFRTLNIELGTLNSGTTTALPLTVNNQFGLLSRPQVNDNRSKEYQDFGSGGIQTSILPGAAN